jgi:CubicO group peptidase (beta-lactamase class C family)
MKLVNLAFLVVLSFPQQSVAQAVDSDAIDAIVRDALKFWRVPGVAVGIVHLGDRRDDQVVYLKGHGVKETGKNDPVTPDTVFPLASCTKAFTTTAMAMLVDEGKMSWDDPVRKHVEFFHLSDPSADALVTLRDLVSHRTGVSSHELLWYRAPWSQEETIRKIGKVKLDYPFRSGFRYQTTMFTTAGWAVGKVARDSVADSGASRSCRDGVADNLGWADFVQKRILDRLEMKNTCVTTAKALASADHASPHRIDSQGQLEVIPWYPMEKPEPAGSINSSARDLCQWMRFQLADGTFAGKQLVSAKNLQETHTPQTIIRLEGNVRDMNPDTTQISYGMGWVVQDYRGQLLVSHAGAIDGFRAHITLIPKAKIGIVLLNNLDKTHMNLAVSNSLVDLLLGLPKKDWNAYVGEQVRKQESAARARYLEREKNRKPESKPSLPLTAYAGTYEDPAYGTAVIALKDNSLVWKWSSFNCRLEHFADDTFTIDSDLLGHPRVQFVVTSGDKVNTMKLMDVMEVEFKRKP